MYILLNQRTLRVEQYAHLWDAVMNDGNVADIGQLIILLTSFTEGPRYIQEHFQDAMTYVKNYCRSDVFINFTRNPKRIEIQQEIFVGQKPHDRHDLLARMFHQKQNSLMNPIKKAKIGGGVKCSMFTIEWQKRGLPYAQILIWLKDSLHVHRGDGFISSEIPNPQEVPDQLFFALQQSR
ncbi:hypothetical protein AVEN_202553-1 [Araneus ventricosus]|uniref:Helitron helicase-like domain-containing protein n=1 Tax=Araneus ventricosus TaxID=182803 RepID=A0A4Y2ISY3_ARAVE|nr:hypothetical protein AVEN_202553-1 [Araneus ventricosus]